MLLNLRQQVGKPVIPGQNAGVAVSVQVSIVLQQLLRQDVVGHHREVERCTAPWWSDTRTAGGSLPASLQSWERKRGEEEEGESLVFYISDETEANLDGSICVSLAERSWVDIFPVPLSRSSMFLY